MHSVMEFEQKVKIMMIDISCKFYLQKNDVHIHTAST